MSDLSMKKSLGTSPVIGKWKGGHVLTNGANQSGDKLIISAAKGDVFEFEDLFAIAGVHDIDPDGKPTGSRKRFLVLERMVAKGDGKDVLKIMPAIIGPGRYCQNVDALPVNGAILEWIA